MRHLVVLFIHFVATLVGLLGPGGVRAIVAESLLLKHQLLEFANCVETLTPLVAVLTLWLWVPVDLHESIGRTDGLVLALLRTWSSDAPHQARAECLWRKAIFALLPAHAGPTGSCSNRLARAATISTVNWRNEDLSGRLRRGPRAAWDTGM